MTQKLSVPLASILFTLLLFSSCVPKQKLVNEQNRVRNLQLDSVKMASKINALQDDITQLKSTISKQDVTNDDLQKKLAALQQQLEATKLEATSRLQDASTRLTMSQKQIAEQQKRLEQLQDLIDQQRKNTLALRKKISDALVSFNSDELTVSIKEGKVYVSLQENLLFPSGSAVVNPKGVQALGNLAAVLNVNPDINVEIEGHTDSIPIRGRYADNWDLGAARANSIVRILTENYAVDPTRVKASGRSKYKPVDTNSTPEGRAKNRRTEIILEPKLDELMKLLQGETTENTQ